MSQVHALSDGQVEQELKKMTAFIKQEAQEKANEIRIKANEEFAMEKSKLVREETDAIDAAYEKKFKQAQMSQQITRSTLANKTRLRVLAARQQLLDDIFERAAQQLAQVAAKDKARLAKTYKGLILEGMYALREPQLQIRARKADYDIVRKAMEEAEKEYKATMHTETKLSIDEDDPLPDGCAGGVFIVGGGGKIDIDNTLETRLKLLEDSALPVVREALFGKNKNRHFFD